MKPPPPPKRKAPPPPARAAQRAFTPTGFVHETQASSRSPEGHAAVPAPGDSAPRSVDSPLGKLLDGRFLVDRVLGEGGMGFVYGGTDTVEQRRVAIKILRTDFLQDTEIVQRFLNEAQAASRIGSPHICSVFGIGRAPNGASYFVMEFLDGQNLAEATDVQRILPVRRILRIGRQIAVGLHAAHTSGIVHRDLKPDNVMLVQSSEGEFVKILDFGVAKVGSARSKLTRAGSVFGTPQYMSPEQASGSGEVDARADIYSLGIILYELAAGRVPFDDENMMNVLSHHMFREPPPLRDVAPQVVPEEFDAIVRRCLQKDPAFRFESMNALAGEIERVLGALPEGQYETIIPSSKRPFSDANPRATSATVRDLPNVRRSRTFGILLVAAVAFATLVVFGATRLLRSDHPEITAEGAPEPPPAQAPPPVVLPPPASPTAALQVAEAAPSTSASAARSSQRKPAGGAKPAAAPPVAPLTKPAAPQPCRNATRNVDPFDDTCKR